MIESFLIEQNVVLLKYESPRQDKRKRARTPKKRRENTFRDRNQYLKCFSINKRKKKMISQ